MDIKAIDSLPCSICVYRRLELPAFPDEDLFDVESGSFVLVLEIW